MMHEPSRTTADRTVRHARWCAGSLGLLAAVTLVPAAADWLDQWRHGGAAVNASWVYVCCWLALIQAAYGLYLYQVPDRSSLQVATWLAVLLAGGYALMATMTGLDRTGKSELVQLLDLRAHVASGRAMLWSLLMLGLTSLVAFALGQAAARASRPAGPR